ncbi:JmjC domain-containing protein [Paraliomyxa miuraensis]|uniref:JmjC domain-containing protein n=1 Tax=Paraliomyxa miuraensis TaxID=376150 RepID=UPI0022560F7A|nr:cupin domain-containing protein [Paraliomyxa miuraensis]MCX4242639.1 cupin-like domain-containing protein [Paraliomyxa miuraensis]
MPDTDRDLTRTYEQVRLAWEQRPVHVPAPWSRPFASEALVMDALRAAADRMRRDGMGTQRMRCFVETMQVEADVGDLLPQRGEDLGGYHARAKARVGGRGFALIADELDHVSRPLWLAATELVGPIVAGTSPRHSSIGVFLGDGRFTGFGLHRDPHSTLMVVVRGRKRLRLWPGDGVLEAALVAHGRSTRYEALLDDSIVIDAQEGDLVYWPSSYHHVAENPEGTLSLTVNLAFGSEQVTPQLLWRHYRQQWFRRVGELEEPSCTRDGRVDLEAIEAACTAIEAVVPDPRAARQAVRRSLAVELLRLETALGFGAPPLVDGVELGDDAVVRCVPGRPIRVEQLREAGLVVAAQGHVLELRDEPRIAALLEGVRGDRPRRVDGLVDAAQRAPGAAERGELLELLHALARIGAVQVVERTGDER